MGTSMASPSPCELWVPIGDLGGAEAKHCGGEDSRGVQTEGVSGDGARPVLPSARMCGTDAAPGGGDGISCSSEPRLAALLCREES
mmetsp:Transcript_12973/g.40766  ORF Transcript_12973/g.40766 Transcript_12973/m.40766 type:complete len:86 (-) Transcript_12973:391-648(-)